MEPVTMAIMALAPLLKSDLVKTAAADAYAGVKEIIRRKWGETSSIAQAVEAVEAKPDSQGKAIVLDEELAAVGAKDDAELMAAVQKLVEAMKQEGIGGKAIEGINISISGGTVQGIVGAQDVKIDTMSFGAVPPAKP
jgi:hypothetical protein